MGALALVRLRMLMRGWTRENGEEAPAREGTWGQMDGTAERIETCGKTACRAAPEDEGDGSVFKDTSTTPRKELSNLSYLPV